MVDAGYGELNDFTGAPICGHKPERPIGVTQDYESIWAPDIWMPIEGSSAFMCIKRFEAAHNWEKGYKPIICLYDRWGRILKQWPEDYIPGFDEVKQAVIDGLKEESRRY
jgi:hypothetical protein